jgi:hypothetical protein
MRSILWNVAGIVIPILIIHVLDGHPSTVRSSIVVAVGIIAANAVGFSEGLHRQLRLWQ